MPKSNITKIVFSMLAIIILLTIVGDISIAATNAGRTAADFLQIGHGARAAGMGGAYTAVAEGSIAAYWNPSGLTSVENSELSLGHFSWFQDITVEQATIATPIGESSVLAASITYVNYGSIQGYDAAGTATGELTAYDWAGGISFGYQLNDNISLGLTGKYIIQKLDQYSASALAADVGFIYHHSGFNFAGAITNLGSGMKFDQETEKLPTAIRMGISASPFDPSLVTSFEIEKRFNSDFVIRQGLELQFEDRYFLRGGFDYVPQQDGRSLATGISFGAGIQFDFARFDYAFTPDDKTTSEDLHRFTLLFGLGH